jgi:energy-coupling factor transporter ATP-binding protein EcfA2
LRIAKFSQHFVDVLDLSQSPLDYFMTVWPDMTREEGRRFLGRFGISGAVQTQVMSQLSDGQKSRVVLAKMAKESPHILFLDEPTNHLDMESIDSLARAINNFSGGMVLVSHDMRLISQVAKEIWLVDNKTVSKFVGDIADFKQHLRSQMHKSSGEILKRNAVGDAIVAAAPVSPPVAVVPTTEASKPEETVEEPATEIDEKTLLKAKKKAEKEAIAERMRIEEEERQRRREEKLKDAEDAKALLELERKQQRELEELRQQKLLQQQQEEEDALRAAIAAEEEQRQERLMKKRAKKERKQLLERLERQFFEMAVKNDVWSQSQQVAFENALLEFPSSIEKAERWSNIASKVEGKSRQQCLARYRFLKAFVAANKSSA